MYGLVFLSLSCCFGFVGLFNFMLSKQVAKVFFMQAIVWGFFFIVLWSLPWAISAPSNEEYVGAYMGLCVLANASGLLVWKNKNTITPASLPVLTNILDSEFSEPPLSIPARPIKGLFVRKLSLVEYLIGAAFIVLSFYLGQELGVRGTAHLPFMFILLSLALSLYPLGLFLVARLHYAGFWVKAVVNLLLAGCYCADFWRLWVSEGWHTLFFALGFSVLTVLNGYFGVLWFKARPNSRPNDLV